MRYSPSTVQDVFLHTVHQGLHKHDEIRRELKPLLADTSVTDEAILKQTQKIMSDESGRQRRLGPATRQRLTIVQSAQAEANAVQSPGVKEESVEKKSKTDVIQQLTDKVEKLTSLVEVMQQSIQTQKLEQFRHAQRGKINEGETIWVSQVH